VAEPDTERELEGLLPLLGDGDGRIRKLLTPTKSREGTRKHRRKFLHSLYHQPPFPDSYVTDLSHKQPHIPPERIFAELRARGAPDECYVISNDSEYDGTTMKLEEALNEVGDGSILLCIPARLAYWESENGSDKWIAERRA
jgi:hypothetical protein